VSTSAFRLTLLDRASRAGVALDDSQARALETYWELLRTWNAKINLTSLSLADCPPSTLDRLFIEPLEAAAVMQRSPINWFDLGSGGGSPAIPLKLVRPEARLTMIESRAKKASFLREAIRRLEMAEAAVLTARIEKLRDAGQSRGTADLITLRAVKINGPMAQAMATLLKPTGKLLMFSSSTPDPQQMGSFSLLSRHVLRSSQTTLYVFVPSAGLEGGG
jgi:16S rRNA (guanine527-N7)-methyltransferase